MSPTRAPRPCPAPLCPELVDGGGYCPTHRKEAEDRRPNANARGYDAKWRRIRAAYLRSLGPVPYCEECGLTQDELEDPIEVDHIDGRGPTGDNSFANLQALCKPHHSLKTALQTNLGGTP